MLRIVQNILPGNQIIPNKPQTREFWAWVNMIFNMLDRERVRKHGPDRVCAEWLLRNGACVKYVGSENLFCNYNLLPPEDAKFGKKIKEIVGNDAGINTLGFDHLKGLTEVDLVRLENCKYVDNKTIDKLSLIKASLKTLEIIGCQNITDDGLLSARHLVNLQNFKAHNLPYVKDQAKVIQEFKQALPNCKVDIQK